MNVLLDDFLTRSVLASLGLALAAGSLGSFVVWRRMAYFGDATAHAAIMGVALALAFDLSVFVGALVASIAMAFAVSALTVAVAIKVVGVLLIAALLIIPAAARPFSDTPERMAVLATIGGVVSVLAGDRRRMAIRFVGRTRNCLCSRHPVRAVDTQPRREAVRLRRAEASIRIDHAGPEDTLRMGKAGSTLRQLSRRKHGDATADEPLNTCWHVSW